MLIRKACSAAFYCQRCGQIHIHEIPYFSPERRTVLYCGTCGQEQAVLERLSGSFLDVKLRCVACGTEKHFVFPLGKLHAVQLERIYCTEDHFELGYIGHRRRIEELLAFNQAEFEALHPYDGKHFLEKQRVLLEALNRVHEMAAGGKIFCPCGHGEILADIRGSSIVLTCAHCGSCYALRAERQRDLARIGHDIDLLTPDMAKKRRMSF